MRFEKWQALGNDYVIVERDALPWKLTPERVRRICEPHFGVGADGVLELGPAAAPHVAELRIFNPDGSEAELSGNGAREAALYLRRSDWTGDEEFSILTPAGEVRPRILSQTSCAMAMGRARTASGAFPSGGPDGTGSLAAGGREWRFQHVSIGNPQCVIDVGDEVEELDLGRIGPEIENHELFPERTNVSFVRVEDSTVRARIFERGVGETLSSGTGACGAAVAAVLRGAASPITVRLDGGELEVDVDNELEVVLVGSAEPVYAGELSQELVAALGSPAV
jgi:diaminopimelate epimerase